MELPVIDGDLLRHLLQRRPSTLHKGDCGRVLLVAGSEGMMGACILAARGALRSGAGLVTLALPPQLFPIAQVAVPEATCRPRAFTEASLASYDVVAIGPGLGQTGESRRALEAILACCHGPLVVDADGLNLIAGSEGDLLPRLLSRQGETIVTPHVGEARRLLGWSGAELTAAARLAMAEALTVRTGAAAILKGAGSLVAAPGRPTHINTTGNPGMATGGAGDVLTGIIAGLWAQKYIRPAAGCEGACAGCDVKGGRLSAFEAALCGAYIHGLAGDLAAATRGEYGLTAGDIAEMTGLAIERVLAPAGRG